MIEDHVDTIALSVDWYRTENTGADRVSLPSVWMPDVKVSESAKNVHNPSMNVR
jgi:hypothetical protein